MAPIGEECAPDLATAYHAVFSVLEGLRFSYGTEPTSTGWYNVAVDPSCTLTVASNWTAHYSTADITGMSGVSVMYMQTVTAIRTGASSMWGNPIVEVDGRGTYQVVPEPVSAMTGTGYNVGGEQSQRLVRALASLALACGAHPAVTL